MDSNSHLKNKISRRDAIKFGSFTAAMATLSAAIAPRHTVAQTLTDPDMDSEENEIPKVSVIKHKTIDDIMRIDPNMERFDQFNTAFNKCMLDGFNMIRLKADDNTDLRHTFASLGSETTESEVKKPGHTDIDLAFDAGAGGVESFTGSGMSRQCSNESGPSIPMPDGSLLPLSLYKQHGSNPNEFKKSPHEYKFETPEDASYAIKKAAKLYGADLVGIAPFEERWLYKTEVHVPMDLDGNPIESHVNPFRKVQFDFKPKSVIVLAFEMDYEAYKVQPSAIGAAATTMGYSQMMETSVRMAHMIRRLGYNTVHAGNAVGISVPLAIQAGLGESSRMGLLVTEEYGPRVRLAKVYTDLEIALDEPKTFGVKEFCEICQKCADSCPSKAISKSDKTTDPDNLPMNDCNGLGVDKWYNDHQKCLSFWGVNKGECGVCISVCPYNKIDMWHHDAAKVITKIPGLRRMARSFDEVFGYGKAGSEKLMKSYWKRRI
ncbi:reductive dehalogenase [Halosquirtibacter xylanolyticus]|uniref:reductive dehalogenase n=1 Tax=Halosquirtibacter xylanolyticus TaxID=3374599 RepID=UPI00374A04A2|nr:reductive dehalogenase [Prolixibacteraceae bacterium]